ncbi:unnamed protein product, partial [Ixodes hexagonus]
GFTAGHDKVFICYWGSWSHYRHGSGAFSVDRVDPTLCTHLVYAFAKIENGVIKAFDDYLDLAKPWHLGMYKKFNELKLANPKLKTIIAIGGWNEGSQKYSQMASTSEGRRKFVESILAFLEFHGFDGLDMDWEYPAQRGGKPEDRDNFSQLLRDLRAAFDKKNYLLTAAVSAGIETAKVSYDIPEISRSLDLISIMGYDFFGAWDEYTGHNSPLRARESASEIEKIMNVEASIDFWISKGANVSKMVLGMPLYGRTFTLADPNNSGLRALTTGPGRAGPFTGEPGYQGYNEICLQLLSGGWKMTRDPYVGAPVVVKDREWIGFDDVESLTAKVEFAMSKGLAGAMVWSIETDDFTGQCGGTVNPLLKAIHKALGLPHTERRFIPPTPAPTPIVWWRPSQETAKNLQAEPELDMPNLQKPLCLRPSATQAPQPLNSDQAKPKSNVQGLPCPTEGWFAHPSDKRKFYACTSRPDGAYNVHEFECDPHTEFDSDIGVCVHER